MIDLREGLLNFIMFMVRHISTYSLNTLLELYGDIYANHIKPDEVAMLILSKDFDKKRIHKCFHKKTVLRHTHV